MHEFFEDLKDSIFGNERQANLSQFADRMGLTYQKKRGVKDLEFDLLDMKIFKGNKRKTIRHFCTQKLPSIEGDLQLFDYQYYPDSGKKQTTIMIFTSASFGFPTFILRPKGTFQKLGALISRGKVEFPDTPAFDQEFVLMSSDKNMIKPYLQKDVLDLLLTLNHLTIEGKGRYLMIYEKNHLQSIDKLLPFYEDAIEIAELMYREPPSGFV